MSALFRAFDPSRLSALAAASTIMRGNIGDVPPLPLTARDIDLKAPSVVVPAPAIIRPASHAVDECRELALALSRDRDRLRGWDRTFVRELVKWRAEPSLFEVDEIAALAERHYWHIRDGAALC